MAKAKAITTATNVEEAVMTNSEVPSTPPPMIADDPFKLIAVIPNFTGSRFIAGKWYNFTEGKEVKVPTQVKSVLRAAHAIYIA